MGKGFDTISIHMGQQWATHGGGSAGAWRVRSARPRPGNGTSLLRGASPSLYSYVRVTWLLRHVGVGVTPPAADYDARNAVAIQQLTLFLPCTGGTMFAAVGLPQVL